MKNFAFFLNLCSALAHAFLLKNIPCNEKIDCLRVRIFTNYCVSRLNQLRWGRHSESKNNANMRVCFDQQLKIEHPAILRLVYSTKYSRRISKVSLLGGNQQEQQKNIPNFQLENSRIKSVTRKLGRAESSSISIELMVEDLSLEVLSKT